MKTILSGIIVLSMLVFASAAFAATGVNDGLFGNNGYQANTVTVTGDNNIGAMWWDLDDGKWIPAAGTGDTGLIVTGQVELYASQEQQTTANFHWGTPPFPALTANLNGHVYMNHPCWVGIRKAGWVQSDQLTKAAAMPKTDDPMVAHPGLDQDAAIPLTWAITVGVGSAPMQWTGGVGQANWGWYSPTRLPVGHTDYSFNITATPSAYQADGTYTLDPDVVIVPDL